MSDNSLILREHGWRQCDRVDQSYNTALVSHSIDLRPRLDERSLSLFVLSQDCDIVGSEAKEPFIELIAGQAIVKASGDCRLGKNPRLLHLELSSEIIELSIHDRFRVEKTYFAGAGRCPTGQLFEEQRDILKRWVGRRYLRSPFPDEFNTRLKGIERRIAQFDKSSDAEDISIVLVQLSSDEDLPDSVPYRLNILLGVRDGLDPERREAIERHFEATLATPGISIEDLVLREEEDITLRDLRFYKRWDKDYRSLPADDERALPPSQADTQ
jgi:hypothetical protein